MPLEQLLREKGAALTRSQRKLMEFIIAHEDESIFLNVEDLAARVDVSVATVVRLSKALGFSGFPEFQKELRHLFRNRLTTTSRLQKTAGLVTSEEDLLIKVLQTDMTNIEETLKQVSVQEFKRFVGKIHSAKRVAVIGLRSVHSLSVFLAVALEFLQKEVWLLQPGIGDMWDRLSRLRKSDVVIGMSFPRYTKLTVDVIRFAKEKGIGTLAITDSPISPLAHYADHVLTARCKMDSFIESFTAPLSLINAVVTALGVKNKKTTLSSLKELEEIWEKQKVYFTAEKLEERR